MERVEAGKRVPDIGRRETNNQKIMYNVHSIVRLLKPLTRDDGVYYLEELCSKNDSDYVHQIIIEARHYMYIASRLYVCAAAVRIRRFQFLRVGSQNIWIGPL